MSDRLTDAEIAELRRLEREATQGPWESDRTSDNEASEEGMADAVAYASITAPEEDGARHIARAWADGPNPKADAPLIAAARTALPRLLDEIATLRSEVERLTVERDEAKANEERLQRAHAVMLRGSLKLTEERDAAREVACKITSRAESAEADAATARAERDAAREEVDRLKRERDEANDRAAHDRDRARHNGSEAARAVRDLHASRAESARLRAQGEEMREHLMSWVAQHGCDCGHPACKRCHDTEAVRAALRTEEKP